MKVVNAPVKANIWIAQSICERILSGELKEGDSLLSKDLDEAYGHAQGNRRYALISLAEEGILVRRRGYAVRVAEGALEKTINFHKKDYDDVIIPALVEKSILLGISRDECFEKILIEFDLQI